MKLDQDRIRAILEREHSFYGDEADTRKDKRLTPAAGDFILSHVAKDMRVLDVGCGNGATLIRGAGQFGYGLGIDNDTEHIRMAENALRESGCANVEFRLLDFERGEALDPGSCDFVFSQRGPIDNDETTRAAVHLLRSDGLIFCEEIGQGHLREVSEVFFPDESAGEYRTLERARSTMEQNCIEIRVAADIYTKWYYPDVYEWLEFQSNIWSWKGKPLPEPDDPRFRLFVERNTISTGEIETTHHVVWVGGVKRQHAGT